MTIATFDQYLSSPKQSINIFKTTSTSTGLTGNSIMQIAGSEVPTHPLAGTSLTPALMTPQTTTGIPYIQDTGNTQYLSKVRYTNTVASTIILYDLLVKVGTFASGATTSCTTPSINSRSLIFPGPAYCYDAQLFVECVTAFTGSLSIQVTYTSPSLGSGRSTGTVVVGTFGVPGAVFRLPLQAGDNSVFSVQSVTTSVATVGTCNILLMRPFWAGRVPVANYNFFSGPVDTGMPIVYTGTSFYPIIYTDGALTGIPVLSLEIAG